jgi:hypothetical protein
MIRSRVSFIAVALLAVAPLATRAAAQGDTGFLRGEGNTDIVLSYGVEDYDKFWVGHVKVEDPGVGEVTRRSTNIYVAHGITEEADLWASVSYVGSHVDGLGGFPDETDWQDAIVGVKQRVYNERCGAGNFSVLLAPSIKMPLGHYEDNAPYAIGDGQTDYRARGIVQWTADNGFFAALESGYDKRSGEPKDEIPINITLGFTVFQQLTLMPFWSNVDSRGGHDISAIPAEGGFPGVEEDTERYGLQAYLRIAENFGLTGLIRRTHDGKNTGDADAVAFGVVFRF